jgi:hypothetical protein
MKTQTSLLLASLVTVCATAAAAPTAPTPPTPPPAPAGAPAQTSCKAAGDRVITIHRAFVNTSSVDLALYATGAWTRAETDAHGKAGPASSGCLAQPDLKKLAAELAKAPWKIAVSPIACDAVSDRTTLFTAPGKPPFTDEACNARPIDPATYAALTALEKALEDASAKAQPPCCKK